jgi:hypothetical protein
MSLTIAVEEGHPVLAPLPAVALVAASVAGVADSEVDLVLALLGLVLLVLVSSSMWL